MGKLWDKTGFQLTKKKSPAPCSPASQPAFHLGTWLLFPVQHNNMYPDSCRVLQMNRNWGELCQKPNTCKMCTNEYGLKPFLISHTHKEIAQRSIDVDVAVHKVGLLGRERVLSSEEKGKSKGHLVQNHHKKLQVPRQGLLKSMSLCISTHAKHTDEPHVQGKISPSQAE